MSSVHPYDYTDIRIEQGPALAVSQSHAVRSLRATIPNSQKTLFCRRLPAAGPRLACASTGTGNSRRSAQIGGALRSFTSFHQARVLLLPALGRIGHSGGIHAHGRPGAAASRARGQAAAMGAVHHHGGVLGRGRGGRRGQRVRLADAASGGAERPGPAREHRACRARGPAVRERCAAARLRQCGPHQPRVRLQDEPGARGRARAGAAAPQRQPCGRAHRQPDRGHGRLRRHPDVPGREHRQGRHPRRPAAPAPAGRNEAQRPGAGRGHGDDRRQRRDRGRHALDRDRRGSSGSGTRTGCCT